MTTTTIPQATPTKLRSGEWGARVQTDDVREGQPIQITARNGKTWEATVTAVVWRGDGVAIVATGQRAKTNRQPGRHSCITDGNCSSFNGGRNCGGWDCDGWL